MSVTTNTVLYPVTDVVKAKEVFSALLGMEPTSDAPYYVGFHVDDQEIGLVPNGQSQGITGPLPFYEVADIAASLAALESAGARITQQPTDVGAGLLVAKVQDPDGNDIGLRQLPTA